METLDQRIRNALSDQGELIEKRMFGGLCFMLDRHMCCGVLGEDLLARVGKSAYAGCLLLPHAREMDFTGRPMTGMVHVSSAGLSDDAILRDWLDRCVANVRSLPSRMD